MGEIFLAWRKANTKALRWKHVYYVQERERRSVWLEWIEQGQEREMRWEKEGDRQIMLRHADKLNVSD